MTESEDKVSTFIITYSEGAGLTKHTILTTDNLEAAISTFSTGGQFRHFILSDARRI